MISSSSLSYPEQTEYCGIIFARNVTYMSSIVNMMIWKCHFYTALDLLIQFYRKRFLILYNKNKKIENLFHNAELYDDSKCVVFLVNKEKPSSDQHDWMFVTRRIRTERSI